MSDEVLKVLSDLSAQVGEANGKLDALRDLVTSHIADDKAVAERVNDLEAANDRKEGTSRVLGFFKPFLHPIGGAVAGALASFFVSHHK